MYVLQQTFRLTWEAGWRLETQLELAAQGELPPKLIEADYKTDLRWDQPHQDQKKSRWGETIIQRTQTHFPTHHKVHLPKRDGMFSTWVRMVGE